MPAPIYEKRGTPITFVNTGGDKQLNLRNLSANAARRGAFVDRGTGASPGEYELRAYVQFASPPTANQAVYLAIVQSDGTHTDGGLSFSETADASITEAAFNSLRQAGAIIAHTAETAEKGMSFRVRVSSRYFTVAILNKTSVALADADSVSAVVATPVYAEIQ